MSNVVILKTILDKTNEAIAVIDDQQKIVISNNKMARLTGIEQAELTGKTIQSIMADINTDKEIFNYEYKPTKKNFIARSERIQCDGREFKIIFFSDNHFNIELANRYAEVKVLKDIYESILNSIDEGIHVADINGRVKYINPSQQKLDGLTTTAIGKHWTEVYELDNETSLVLKALNEGLYTHDAYQNYVTRDGKYVSIVCSAMPLYSDEKIIGAVAITKEFLKFKELAEKVLSLHEHIHQKGKKRKVGNENPSYTFDHILGKNKLILDSIKWGKAGANSDSSVLIFGETGTGKEMIAQSIHNESRRANGPFLALNCAAIPENLLEGILFGTSKGAFTGAIDRAGLIELASEGTLFLDEINSMPYQLQSKLLRTVEDKRIMRLGGKESISVDVRILASCNIEPTEAIEKGQLRSDLFYRLAIIYIYLPPLRERLDDLNILCTHFLNKYCREMNKQKCDLSSEVRSLFHYYNWPGNVRELMHCIECAVNLVEDNENIICAEHLPRYLRIRTQNLGGSTTNLPLYEEQAVPKNTYNILNNHSNGIDEPVNIIKQIQLTEKDEIISALKRTKGNIAQAASELGLSRQCLHYRLKKYNLR